MNSVKKSTPFPDYANPAKTTPLVRCKHCNGHIINKYDEAYCINCSRPVNQIHPTFTDEELKRERKSETTIRRKYAR